MYKPQPQDFPDSPYARELFGDMNALRFDPTLETEYCSAHLPRVRRRLRLYFGFLTALSLAFAVRQIWVEGWWTAFSVAHWAVLVPAAGALLCLAWSAHYREIYRTAGPWVGGAFNVVFALLIARSIAAGNIEELAVLSVGTVGIFFFSGFLFRSAAAICAVTLLAFAAGAVAFGVPWPELLKCVAVTALTAIVSAAVYHDVEHTYRVGFLESALIGHLVARDGLSGLMNRPAFEEHLDRVWKHAMRDRRSITVFMIDLDELEAYNDDYGMEAGDAALRAVAKEIRDFGRRPLDLAARYDAARFALVLYDLAGSHVSDMAERLRLRIAQLRIGGMTASIGVSLGVPALGRAPQGLVDLSGAALRDAKHAGGDRVVFKGEHSFAPLRTGSYRLPRAGRLARGA